VREASARALVLAGLHPVTAEDGWEAWELLGERRFDAVVTDLEMPRLDGFDLITRIRREPTLRHLPILVVSSRGSRATRERALAVGADALLPKTPGKRALAEAVTNLLGASARGGDGTRDR
jgi:CheY-like chemotaxis protein